MEQRIELKLTVKQDDALKRALKNSTPAQIIGAFCCRSELPLIQELREAGFEIGKLGLALFDSAGYTVVHPDVEIKVDAEMRERLNRAYCEPYNVIPTDPEDEFSDWRQGFLVAMETLRIDFRGNKDE